MLLPYPLDVLLPNPVKLLAAVMLTQAPDEASAPDVVLAAAMVGAHRPLAPVESSAYRVSPGPTTCYRQGAPFACTITIVDGFPMEVGTAAAYIQMRNAAHAAGVALRVVSGFRPMAQQRALYAAYLAHAGPLAARPGYSEHQSGHAVDLNTPEAGVLSWLNAHAATYGFRRTIRSEGWHWEHGT